MAERQTAAGNGGEKRLAVITHGLQTAHTYANQLRELFGGGIRVAAYALEEGFPERITADAVLISTHAIYTLIEPRLRECRNVTIADLTLPKHAVKKLLSLPEGTKAMLVNTTMEMAIDTINLIYNSGIHHLELFPVYPGMEQVPPAQLAITPGERDLVPPQVSRILDLGDRMLSMRTITNLASKLGMTRRLQSDVVKAYAGELLQRDQGIEQLITRVREQEKKLELVMQIFDGGILTLTEQGEVSFLNGAAEQLLGKKSFSIMGKRLWEVFPEFGDIGLLQMTEPLRDRVMTVGEQLMDVSVYPLSGTSPDDGYLLMVKTLQDVELNQYKVRRQLISKGHVAKHNFSDIKTCSPSMIRLKEAAARMARSSSSLVIYGPSGTGKELFAQSIHNASPRKDYPFIAINCASIPESLLESELFGYSEGAFTGARKGGKAGYFELAHKGTLFLDEIGELELPLQARLLRALQEKEVIRVGGDRVISVDVRVISASNKRLLDLVRQGKFREDLYYRLNVLSLEILPLCRRKEDIPLLLEDIKEELGMTFSLDSEAMEFLTEYPWRGNVRELRNFVERISCLDKERIGLTEVQEWLDGQEEERGGKHDIGHGGERGGESGGGRGGEYGGGRGGQHGGGHGGESDGGHGGEYGGESGGTGKNGLPAGQTGGQMGGLAGERALLSHFFLQERRNMSRYGEILSLLYQNKRVGIRQGRQGLCRSLSEKGVTVSEQEVRLCLRRLQAYGLAEIHAGRGGTELTALGELAWEQLVREQLTRQKDGAAEGWGGPDGNPAVSSVNR